MKDESDSPNEQRRDFLDCLEYAYLPPDSDEPVPCDRATFQYWWDKEPEWYYKKQDTVGRFSITTRFTGVDSHFSVPPMWWEVSVNEEFHSRSQRAFATLEEALKRHSELVAALEAGTLDEA